MNIRFYPEIYKLLLDKANEANMSVAAYIVMTMTNHVKQ